VIPPIGSNPYGIEATRRFAWEIARTSGGAAPDVVVVPIAYSDGLDGVWKGWVELAALAS